MVGPFTGPTAESGRYQVQGAKLAVDEVNKAAGGDGRQFETGHRGVVPGRPMKAWRTTWLVTVHDLNPRVKCKRVHGFRFGAVMVR
jgi:hypothetical protein